jgi:hypothetical protein
MICVQNAHEADAAGVSVSQTLPQNKIKEIHIQIPDQRRIYKK